MALDPSIALQVQQPNPANFISSFLDLGQKKLQLDKSRETFDADVAQRKAESSSSQSAATVNAANVQPLIAQQAANTTTAQQQASSATLATARAHILNAKQQTTSLMTLPDSELTTAAITDSIKKSMANLNASPEATTQALADVPPAGTAPKDLRKYVLDSFVHAMGAEQQLNAQYPNAIPVQTGGATQFVGSGNAQVAATPPGTPTGASPIPNQVGPGAQEEVQTDAQGNRFIVQKSPQGVIVNTRPVPGSTTGASPGVGPVNLPPNETAQTRDALQAERQGALQQVQNAGNLHQINREIYGLADTATTGKLGELRNKIGSAIGFTADSTEAADYNSLGKMLARANQQLSQNMGPHTNAGLEQTNAANGTLNYDRNTIKKIANLNDALVTGTQMYQQGLERAIKQNGIFGKREFDQAWGANMDPDALRLKNAVDNKDNGQVQMLLKQAGGKGSAGAKALLDKLSKLDALAENGRP